MKIKSLQEYTKYTDLYKSDGKIRLYRGQSENWPLKSKLLRIVEKKNKIKEFYKIEKNIFNEFKKTSSPWNANIAKFNDWQTLSIGQHYGLPTRLLDWTKNPNIALWFALHERKENLNDRVVWGLVVENENLADFKKDDLFSDRFIKVFEPTGIDDPRIISQESWLSVQSILLFERNGDGLPVFNEIGIMNELEEFESYLIRIFIPEEFRTSILTELDNQGINYCSLFPGLDGLCKKLEWEIIQ